MPPRTMVRGLKDNTSKREYVCVEQRRSYYLNSAVVHAVHTITVLIVISKINTVCGTKTTTQRQYQIMQQGG